MIITLIILLYIASIFFCRWINYILYKEDRSHPILWGVWLIPIVSPIVWILIFLLDRKKDGMKLNWFTGKNWDK